jgi:hypothetical protein
MNDDLFVFIRCAPGQPPCLATKFDAHAVSSFAGFDDVIDTACAAVNTTDCEVHVLRGGLKGEWIGYAFYRDDGAVCWHDPLTEVV